MSDIVLTISMETALPEVLDGEVKEIKKKSVEGNDIVTEFEDSSKQIEKDMLDFNKEIEIHETLESLRNVVASFESLDKKDFLYLATIADCAGIQLNRDASSFIPSLESFKSGSKQVVMESFSDKVKDSFKKAWQTFIKFLLDSVEYVKRTFNNILNSENKLKETLDALAGYNENIAFKIKKEDSKFKLLSHLVNPSTGKFDKNYLKIKSDNLIKLLITTGNLIKNYKIDLNQDDNLNAQFFFVDNLIKNFKKVGTDGENVSIYKPEIIPLGMNDIEFFINEESGHKTLNKITTRHPVDLEINELIFQSNYSDFVNAFTVLKHFNIKQEILKDTQELSNKIKTYKYDNTTPSTELKTFLKVCTQLLNLNSQLMFAFNNSLHMCIYMLELVKKHKAGKQDSDTV